MSNPETPPQTPPAPVHSEATEVHSEPPAAQASSNGKPEESADANAHGSTISDAPGGTDAQEGTASQQDDTASQDAQNMEDEGGGAHPDEQQSATAPSPGGGEKKRRRRRRKKKTGTQVAGEAGTSEPSAETDDAPADGTSADGTSAPAAEAQRVEKRDRKKDRKHSGPRERPPVNGGDIIFGKILEITDEAIIIDIPGKAHAIFDRREMLLPDDDEPAKPGPSEPAQIANDKPPTDEVDGAALPHEQAADPPDGVAPAAVDSPVEEVTASPIDAPVAETPPPEDPAVRETPKEPKVPRVTLEIGADFIAVVHNDGARGGLVVLTHHPNRVEKTKPIVEKAFQDKSTVLGLVSGVIKGGIEVDIDGLRAFAPGSHVDLRMGADLSYLLGERLPFLVTQYAKRGRDVVLSRRAMIEEEAKKARTDALARLKVGEEVDGVVRSVVAFGAFIDVGGLEGLVPLQEMSHNRADGPGDVFTAGETTRVKVIKVDERGKVWLSRKATIPDPWHEVAQKYAQGTRHMGKVVRLQPFGAFIELEPGVDGLIHTQDLSIKWVESPSDVVKINDPIEVVVAHVDSANRKIALHPAPQGDAANETPQRVVPHKPVKARVVTIESGGLVVRILGVTGRNARGYITSAGTGTPRGTELRKAFKVGQDVDAKVIEMDPRRGEAKLSIKAFSEEQERSAYQQYRQQLKAEARFTLADLLTKKGSSR